MGARSEAGLGSSRSTPITVASILLFTLGVLGAIGSLTLLSLASLVQAPQFQVGRPTPAELADAISLLVTTSSVGLLISLLNVVAGYLLWRSLKSGGMLGVTTCSTDTLLSLVLLPPPTSSAYYAVTVALLGFALNLAIIILILIGWRSLR